MLSVTAAAMVIGVVETSRELMALCMVPSVIVNVILASSRSCASRIRINAPDPVVRVVCVLTSVHLVHASPRLEVRSRWHTATNLLLGHINRTPVVASLTETTSLSPSASIAYVDILGNCISLQAALGLHRCQQRIANILANDAASASYDPRAGLDV